MARRSKTVELDGAKFRIGSFSFKEMSELFGVSNIDASDGTLRANIEEVLLRSINNALPENETKWDHEKLLEETDLVLRPWLFNEILEFCGLSVKDKAPGEPLAVA